VSKFFPSPFFFLVSSFVLSFSTLLLGNTIGPNVTVSMSDVIFARCEILSSPGGNATFFSGSLVSRTNPSSVIGILGVWVQEKYGLSFLSSIDLPNSWESGETVKDVSTITQANVPQATAIASGSHVFVQYVCVFLLCFVDRCVWNRHGGGAVDLSFPGSESSDVSIQFIKTDQSSFPFSWTLIYSHTRNDGHFESFAISFAHAKVTVVPSYYTSQLEVNERGLHWCCFFESRV
jgi:hypothetical protein